MISIIRMNPYIGITHMSPKYETKKFKQGYSYVVGCDEVGRGCLAGPVVAAAVVLDFADHLPWFHKVRDSKTLPSKQREDLAELIKRDSCGYGIGEVSEKTIDRVNIHQATFLAMQAAVKNLLQKVSRESSPPEKLFVFVDGKYVIPKINFDQEAVIRGDGKVLSIAAASIIAKVHRDRLMEKFHLKYPEFDFKNNKGYPTAKHRSSILKHGLRSIHRLSFCDHLTLSSKI